MLNTFHKKKEKNEDHHLIIFDYKSRYLLLLVSIKMNIFYYSAQFIDETLTTINLITNEFNVNETNVTTYENEFWSSTSSLDIIQSKIIKQQWININQSKKGNSSNIFWKKINSKYNILFNYYIKYILKIIQHIF